MARKMKTFKCETMSHDIFSTKFCRDGKADTLSRTDYKEPPVIAYEMLILNDQGGSVMDITDDITATLRRRIMGILRWFALNRELQNVKDRKVDLLQKNAQH